MKDCITSSLFILICWLLPLNQPAFGEYNSSQPLPPPACNLQVNAGPDAFLCYPGGDVTLSGSIIGSSVFAEWSPSTGLNNPLILNPIATVTTPTTYTFTGWGIDNSNPSIIVNGDFESGNTGFSSAYSYEVDQPGIQTELGGDGTYAVVRNPKFVHANFSACVDHTGGGNMMVVNGAQNLQDVWCQTIPVTPNTWYNISAFVTSVHLSSPAQLQFSINGSPIGSVVNAFFLTCIWTPFNAYWNSGSNTSATICILNLNTSTGGNDFALDDISMRQLCYVQDQVLVDVVDEVISDPVILGPVEVCDGDLAIYSVSFPPNPQILTYTWTLASGGNILSGQGTSQITVQWKDPGSTGLCLSVTSRCDVNGGCIDINVNDIPQAPSIMGPSQLCTSETATFSTINTDPDNTYNWIIPPEIIILSGAGTNEIEIKWVQEGETEICLEVSNSCGTIVNCIPLNLYPAYFNHLDTVICKGTSLVVNGNVYGNGNWTGTEYMTTVNGCDSIIEVDITEATAPPLEIDTELSTDYNGFGVPCFGDASGKAEVNLLSGGTPPFSFQWSNGFNQQTATNLGAGWYDVTVTDSKGCFSTDRIEITEPDQMQYELVIEDISCFGEADGSIQLTNIQGGIAPWTTSFDNNSFQSNSLYQNLREGAHQLEIKDQNGCTIEEQFVINEPEYWNVELGRDTSIAYGELLTYTPVISGTPSGALQISWSDNQCDNCFTRTFPATSNMTLSILVTDENGCIAEDAVNIELNMDIFMPNIFTPNGDHSNDRFTIYSNALEVIESMAVYDRWGNLVFEGTHIQPNNESTGWDGSIKGKSALPGVYVYRITVKFKDGSRAVKHGDVTIVR